MNEEIIFKWDREMIEMILESEMYGWKKFIKKMEKYYVTIFL